MITTGETILTTGDIARSLKVRPERVKHWCDAGLITCFRTPGGQRRIYASWLKEALDAGRIPPPRGRRGRH